MEEKIHLKGVVMEDFVNYAKPSLFLITCKCDWKCCHEANIPITVCQNEPVVRQATKEFLISSILFLESYSIEYILELLNFIAVSLSRLYSNLKP